MALLNDIALSHPGRDHRLFGHRSKDGKGVAAEFRTALQAEQELRAKAQVLQLQRAAATAELLAGARFGPSMDAMALASTRLGLAPFKNITLSQSDCLQGCGPMPSPPRRATGQPRLRCRRAGSGRMRR